MSANGHDPQGWTLWAGTVGFTSPVEDRVRAAVATGCSSLSMGPFDLPTTDSAGLAVQNLGVQVRDHGLEIIVDPLMNWYPFQGAVQTPFAALSASQTLAAAAALGATTVTAIAQLRRHLGEPHRENRCPAPTPAVPVDELTEHFAVLCDQAADLGLVVQLEFMPMSDVRDLQAAWDIVRNADRANAGLVIDSWHFFRGTPDFGVLAKIPGIWISAVQLNDALSEVTGTLFDDVRHRLLPGDGAFDLPRLLQVLANTGGLRSVGPEVIGPRLAALPAVDAARLALACSRSIVTRALHSSTHTAADGGGR